MLRTKQDQKSKDELEQVENELAEKYSEKMYIQIMGELEGVNDSEEGGFQIVQKLFRISPNIQECPVRFSSVSKNFQIFCKVSRVSCYFPQCPKTFQSIWKVSRIPGSFLDCPTIFQGVLKFSRLSEKF